MHSGANYIDDFLYMSLTVRLEKLRFILEEMELAYYLAKMLQMIKTLECFHDI